MKTLTQILKETKAEFEGLGIDTPILDARLLLQHACKITFEDLLLTSKRVITESELETLRELVARRKNREPVSRIVGRRAFWTLEFKVSRETLDPRHDSETIIEAAIRFSPSAPGRILDIGTGTGCLLLSLLREWPEAEGVGIDISAAAVETARENMEMLGFSSRAAFLETGWENYAPAEPFDLLVSNPPYIATGEAADLAPEVRNFDPPRALFAGEDGLDAYRSIIPRLPLFLKAGGLAIFEIGHTQAEAVKQLLAGTGLNVLQTVPDLAGSDRVVVAQQTGAFAEKPLKSGL